MRNKLVTPHERVEDGGDIRETLRERVQVRRRPGVRLAGRAELGDERVVLGSVRLAVLVLADERRGRLGDVVPEDADWVGKVNAVSFAGLGLGRAKGLTY